jgi:hypothetical protein
MLIEDIGGSNILLTLQSGMEYLLGIFYGKVNGNDQTGDKLLNSTNPIDLIEDPRILFTFETRFSTTLVPSFPDEVDDSGDWLLTGTVLIGETFPGELPPPPLVPEPSAIAGIVVLGLGSLLHIKTHKG